MAVPRRVGDGCVIAVVCRLPDRRYWTPEVVNVTDLEAGDIGIGHRHRRHRECACTIPEVKLSCLARRACDAVPSSRPLEPETGYFGLLGRAHRAHLATHGLHLVEVTGVLRARQRWRARKPILRRRQ